MESVVNRKAYHDYFIIEEFEAGIQLFGPEIKCIREGRINLKDSFVKIKNNEAFLINTHIAVYEKISNFDSYDPTRSRKLLLHKKEIDKIRGKIDEKGMSMVPLSAYFNKRNYLKIKIALVKGKHTFDKKQVLKEKDIKRQMEKEIKSY
jgi:SsrA-binding protein